MKKIFVIFGLIYITTQAYSWGANVLESQCINKSIERISLPASNNINVAGSDNDWFCYTASNNKVNCFLADSEACPAYTVICTLGTYTESNKDWTITHTDYKTTKGGALIGKRICATSYAGSGADRWYGKDGFLQPKPFTDCTDKKWQRNDSISKTNEVMVINSKAILSTNNYPMQYWLHYDINNTAQYPNVCVGYYCKGADGKYAEPCNDGTCDASCSSNKTTLQKGKGTSDKKVNNDAHIDIVTPYLDALKSKFDTLTI